MDPNKKIAFYDNFFACVVAAVCAVILAWLPEKNFSSLFWAIFVCVFAFFSLLFTLILKCYRFFLKDREKFFYVLKNSCKALLFLLFLIAIGAGYMCFVIFVLIPTFSKLSDNIETAAFWSSSHSYFLCGFANSIDFLTFLAIIFLPIVAVPILLPSLSNLYAAYNFICSYIDRESNYRAYLDANKTHINLFIRPSVSKFNMTFANKNCSVSIDMINLNKIRIVDKIKKQELIMIKKIYFKEYFVPVKNDSRKGIVMFLLHEFDYDTDAEFLIIGLSNYNYDVSKKVIQHKNLYLDINSASEAELTAIPGITIAKAKHIAKVRREKRGLLTMGQFFRAAKLEEEFIEQIKTSGNKILLSELPEYKRIVMNEPK